MLLWKKNKSIYTRRILIGFFVVAGIACYLGCSSGNGKYSEEREVIGTFVRVDICRRSHSRETLESAMRDVWQRFEEIETRMNAYDSDTDIGRVNSANGRMVTVHQDVYRLIEQSIAYAYKTQGAFDITVLPLIELWQESEQQDRLPSSQDIARVLDKIGVQHIQLDSSGEDFTVGCRGCKIDLGGIAKGYAVDEAARIIKQHGIFDFMINAGGDIYASGNHCGGKNHGWRIAVQHPRVCDEWADVVGVSNVAVTTSGDYEQFYEIEGQVFSHIMNPETGYPQKHIVSATVVAPTAAEADVFSTALTVWPVEQGISFVEGLGPSYAALILKETANGKIEYYATATYKKLNTLAAEEGKLLSVNPGAP